jgi:FtsZ-binding cell division protein ZapB
MDYKRIDGVLYVIESKYAKALEIISSQQCLIDELEEKVTDLNVDLSDALSELTHAHDEISNLELELKEARCGD